MQCSIRKLSNPCNFKFCLSVPLFVCLFVQSNCMYFVFPCGLKDSVAYKFTHQPFYFPTHTIHNLHNTQKATHLALSQHLLSSEDLAATSRTSFTRVSLGGFVRLYKVVPLVAAGGREWRGEGARIQSVSRRYLPTFKIFFFFVPLTRRPFLLFL